MDPFPEPAVEQLFFERLMERLPDQVYFKDLEGRFLAINQTQAAFLGVDSPAEAIGKTDFDFFEEDIARQMDADEREIIRTRTGFVGKEERTQGKTGRKRWVVCSKLPLTGKNGEIIGTFGTSRDISEVKEARESLEEQHRLLSTLIDILPCRIFVKDREGRIRLINNNYREALGLPSVYDAIGRRLSDLTTDERASVMALEDRAVLDDGREILNREAFDASPLHDKRWMLLSKVPLRDGNNKIQGIVGMAADITAQKLAEARAIEAQRALEIKNRQMEGELDLARDLQTELMESSLRSVQDAMDANAPFAPEIAFRYAPSELLAGDFFDLQPLSPYKFSLLLCDVMGHGVKAALVTTLVRGLLADLKAEKMTPSQVLERLNDRLCPLLDRAPLPRFVTALYATFDIDKGVVAIANAGHPWPLFQTGNERANSLFQKECGPALGIIRGEKFSNESISIKKGDRIMFFTDGWTEERDTEGNEFGIERLGQSLSRTKGSNANEALKKMAASIQSFSSNESYSDDLCAVMAAF